MVKQKAKYSNKNEFLHGLLSQGKYSEAYNLLQREPQIVRHIDPSELPEIIGNLKREIGEEEANKIREAVRISGLVKKSGESLPEGWEQKLLEERILKKQKREKSK